MSNIGMEMKLDGTWATLTPAQFTKMLAKLTPQERAYVLHMRRELGIDKEAK